MQNKKKKVSLKKMMFEEALMSNRGLEIFQKRGLARNRWRKNLGGSCDLQRSYALLHEIEGNRILFVRKLLDCEKIWLIGFFYFISEQSGS